MKWRRQKQHQSSSPTSSFSLSSVLPFSWVSKLKQIATKPTKHNPNPAPRSPPAPARSASFHADTLLTRTRSTQRRSARHNSTGDFNWPPFPTSSDSEGFDHHPVTVHRHPPRRRHRQRRKPKVRVYSPRPSAVQSKVVGGGLERFAVVKCSCDLQRDFRESMVEMILERGIGRPEDLERLLACYLALNDEAHHDVIVKVFRQVWFELNPSRVACDEFK